MFIPKSVFLGLLFAALGLAAGWMLKDSANDVASASFPAATVSQDVPAVAGPPVSTGPVRGSTTAITVDPSTGAISSDSSTVRTTTHVEQAPDGSLVGVSEAVTRPMPVAVPTGPLSPPVAPLAPGAGYPSPAPTTAAPQPAATAPRSPIQPAAVAPSSPLPPAAVAPPSPITINSANASQAATGQALALEIPPFFGEDLFKPLPGAKSRGVAFSEWESYRTDVAGRNILATTDDSNVFRDRNGKLNGNTGDTDASGLNVTDATDSVIFGTESADEPPYQTVTQGVVDIATANPSDLQDLTDSSDEGDDGDADLPDPGANGPVDTSVETPTTQRTSSTSGLDAVGDTDTGDPVSSTTVDAGTTAVSGIPDGLDAKQAAATKQAAADKKAAARKKVAANTGPAATAAVVSTANASPPNAPSSGAETDESGGGDGYNDGYDFPYVSWTKAINSNVASAVHTDEGTTLASGQEATVIGADGYDDDDNRAVGENITITRDDGNVVLGGTGDVNAQIGDSEQGAVIMGVTRTYIQGGGAY